MYPAPADSLLTVSEVARKFNCSTRHIWRLVDAKQFPAPIRLGSKLRRWSRASIEQYLAEKGR
jgi:excisionase family DNA binding protein